MPKADSSCTRITRRAAIATVAGSLAQPIAPALACDLAASDPILAAIEAHRRVYAQLLALLDAQQAAGRAHRAANPSARRALDAHLQTLLDAEGPLGCREREAADLLLALAPRTLAGAAALLRYVRERFAIDGYGLYEEDGYRALLLSTERCIDRALSRSS